jgi:excisionase family DNA binding protein
MPTAKKVKGRITLDEAVEILPVSRSTLQKLTASGEVSSVRLGVRRWYDPDQLGRELEARGARGPAYQGKK